MTTYPVETTTQASRPPDRFSAWFWSIDARRPRRSKADLCTPFTDHTHRADGNLHF